MRQVEQMNQDALLKSTIRHLLELRQRCEDQQKKLLREPVLRSIAQSRRVQRMMISGEARSYRDLMDLSGNSNTQLSMLVRLCALSPVIVGKLLSGELDVKLETLLKIKTLCWKEQHEFLGCAPLARRR